MKYNDLFAIITPSISDEYIQHYPLHVIITLEKDLLYDQQHELCIYLNFMHVSTGKVSDGS